MSKIVSGKMLQTFLLINSKRFNFSKGRPRGMEIAKMKLLFPSVQIATRQLLHKRQLLMLAFCTNEEKRFVLCIGRCYGIAYNVYTATVVYSLLVLSLLKFF